MKQVNRLSPCNINCGEGYQYRNITSPEKCTATQYRRCWIGKCLTKNQCLNLIQKLQNEYNARLYSFNKYCGHWQYKGKLEHMNLNRDERMKLNEKSQLDDEGGCKQTVTDGCKWAYRDFLNAQLNLIDNDDLKYCYGQAMHRGNSNPIDSFLRLIKSQDNSAITAWFDMANKSCKF